MMTVTPIEHYNERTNWAFLLNTSTGGMVKFIWFADERIQVENGKEVLLLIFDPKNKKLNPHKWFTKDEARDLWKDLIIAGYNRADDALEYFSRLVEECTE